VSILKQNPLIKSANHLIECTLTVSILEVPFFFIAGLLAIERTTSLLLTDAALSELLKTAPCRVKISVRACIYVYNFLMKERAVQCLSTKTPLKLLTIGR
jgi:hypothetical protein